MSGRIGVEPGRGSTVLGGGDAPAFVLPAFNDDGGEVPAPAAIGKYPVVGRVGAGAMGVVYKCLQPELDREVAVKVLIAARHAEPEMVRRFQNEARAAAKLSHPNVVPVFDVGSDGGVPFLVMEYVPGPSLDRLIGDPVLTLDVTLRVVYHLAGALQEAHDQGLIHRDVKPSNVLIDPAGRPRLTDFGLAKSVTDARGLSGTGDIIGTPRYMAPEQAFGAPDEVDHRADVYALGAVFYEMLTGAPLVDGPNPLAVLRNLADGQPVPVRERNPDVPAEVAAVCERATAKEPAARYPSARALAQAIEQCMLANWFGKPEVERLAGFAMFAGPAAPRARRPRRFWAATVGGALGLVLVGFAAARWLTPAGRIQPPPGRSAEPPIDADRVLARARQEVRQLPAVTDPQTHRERLAAVVAELSAAVAQQPDERERRVLRARLLRRSGDYQAATADLVQATGRGPADPGLVAERAVCRYSGEVILLGGLAEEVMRPGPSDELKDDLAALARAKDPAQRALARLMSAVVGLGPESIREALGAGPPPASAMPELRPDVLLVWADGALRAPEVPKPEGAARPDPTAESFRLIRAGLEADHHHAGLLFLRALAWQRRAALEGEGSEEGEPTGQRHRPAFEAAFARFRAAAPRSGVEAAVARAVLFANQWRHDAALDQLGEVFTQSGVPPHLYALRCWFHLRSPDEGTLSGRQLERMLRDLEPAFETPPDGHTPYLARAVALAATGRWADARRDVRECRRLVPAPPDAWDESVREWLAAADAPASKFLNETVEVLDEFSVPLEVRIRLGGEVLARLQDPAEREALGADEAKSLAGWGAFRLAKYAAQQDDRESVLKHLRAALEARLDDLTPVQAREDDNVKAWNGDDAFVKLYAEFEPAADKDKKG